MERATLPPPRRATSTSRWEGAPEPGDVGGLDVPVTFDEGTPDAPGEGQVEAAPSVVVEALEDRGPSGTIRIASARADLGPGGTQRIPVQPRVVAPTLRMKNRPHAHAATVLTRLPRRRSRVHVASVIALGLVLGVILGASARTALVASPANAPATTAQAAPPAVAITSTPAAQPGPVASGVPALPPTTVEPQAAASTQSAGHAPRAPRRGSSKAAVF
jgi:hypothetical protein